MRIALINTSKKPKAYPISLLKIGAYLSDHGHECKLFTNELPRVNEFDEIWVTTLFTFEIPHSLGIIEEAIKRAKRVKVGGIASSLLPGYFKDKDIDLHIGLWNEVEEYSPKYSLLDEIPEYSITHITRGCINKCGFCMVPKLEPEFKRHENWQNDIHPESNKILFYDNNWIAQEYNDLKKDTENILKIINERNIKEIDFNQGLDCRLLTDEKADLLAQLPITPIRFAFDGMHEDGHWQQAIEKMAIRGKRNFRSYVLYNYKDKPEDYYYRIKEHVRLADLYSIECKAFPMRYQPILDVDVQKRHVGKYWTFKKRSAVLSILSRATQNGVASFTGGGEKFTSMDEFEYWFGKDYKEFNKILKYPKLNELLEKKKGKLRITRAGGKRSLLKDNDT